MQCHFHSGETKRDWQSVTTPILMFPKDFTSCSSLIALFAFPLWDICPFIWWSVIDSSFICPFIDTAPKRIISNRASADSASYSRPESTADEALFTLTQLLYYSFPIALCKFMWIQKNIHPTCFYFRLRTPCGWWSGTATDCSSASSATPSSSPSGPRGKMSIKICVPSGFLTGNTGWSLQTVKPAIDLDLRRWDVTYAILPGQ